MPSDSSQPGNPNKQDLISTLGNPLASEEEWINASQSLGEVKQEKSNAEKRQQKNKLLAEFGILAAVGAGAFGLFALTRTANVAPSIVPNPPPSMMAPAAGSKAGKEIDFGPYMSNVQKSIKRNWHPPRGDYTNRIVVIFDISKIGNLSKLRLDRSSGVAAADKAALDAVNDAWREFGALPEGTPDDKVSIQFTFDYNILTKNKPDTTNQDIPPFSAG